MSANKTNGPWAVEDLGGPTYLDGVEANYAIKDGNGDYVGYAFSLNDALKLAAANELLEALQHLVGMLKAAGYGTAHADAAIAKATGEQQ